jgi:hypothetical protein
MRECRKTARSSKSGGAIVRNCDDCDHSKCVVASVLGCLMSTLLSSSEKGGLVGDKVLARVEVEVMLLLLV